MAPRRQFLSPVSWNSREPLSLWGRQKLLWNQKQSEMVWVPKLPNLWRSEGHWRCISRLSDLVTGHSRQIPPAAAFRHSWPHACLLYLTFTELVSWRRISFSLFILLMSWLCGKIKQVVKLSVVLNGFLISVWSCAWWHSHTWHKLAFTRLWPSMNKHF